MTMLTASLGAVELFSGAGEALFFRDSEEYVELR